MAKVSKKIDNVGHGYANLIKRIAKMSLVSLPVVVGFALFGFLIVANTPDGFVPDEDKGYAMVLVNLPPGASRNRTEDVMRKADDVIRQDPAVDSTTMIAGLDLLAGGGSSSNAGVFFVKLKDYEERPTRDLSSFAFVYRMYGALAGIPEATFFPVNPAAIDGLGTVGGFEFIMEALEGQDPTVLAQISRSLIVAANEAPEIASFFTTFNANTPQLNVQLDRERAQVLGLNIASVYNALQATLAATISTTSTSMAAHGRSGCRLKKSTAPVLKTSTPSLFARTQARWSNSLPSCKLNCPVARTTSPATTTTVLFPSTATHHRVLGWVKLSMQWQRGSRCLAKRLCL